jgi:uncharacterized protein (DUF488 family)
MNESGRQLVFTIGHSTRTIDEFLELLGTNGATMVADIRTIPRSRHNPQFNKDSLPEALKAVSIGYEHMPGFGGLRHPDRESLNSGWRNSSFRGFADYMQTAEFEEQLENLIKLGAEQTPALMCAEALPWRCHRSLIADALTVRGVAVQHIMGKGKILPHSLTPWAVVHGRKIHYPPVPGTEHHE